jgi:hypothetical protein
MPANDESSSNNKTTRQILMDPCPLRTVAVDNLAQRINQRRTNHQLLPTTTTASATRNNNHNNHNNNDSWCYSTRGLANGTIVVGEVGKATKTDINKRTRLILQLD